MKDNKDVDSLSHTTWRCQYHVVFAPKYRRMVIYGQIKKDIGQILRQLCEQKGIEIIEAEACPDHIHMLISFSPKYSISYVMGYLKGKSSLMIFDRHANLKYKYGNRHLFMGSAVCMAQDNRGGRPDMSKRIEQMVTDLGLNETQAKEFKAVMEEMRPNRNASGERPSREEMEKKRNEADAKLKKILTDEQYKKYQSMRPQRGQRRGK